MTRVSIAIVVAVFAVTTTKAHADGPYEGDWRSGPMRIEVAVESWGGDCGPRPQSTTIPGGSLIHVSQSGDDLTFAGRPQRTTRGCWSENASVRRVSSRYESNTWTIVCRTPENDPRAEVGTYTLRAVGTDRIEFRDASRYDWALNDSRCVATISSTQTFQRVVGAATNPAATAETPPVGAAPEPACSPGAPSRISFRPSQATVEPGGRTCFAARVVDANGCAVPGRSPRLELRAPEGARGRLEGNCFVAAESAAEGEGEFIVSAREGSLEAQARVRVRTPDLSDLIARRAEGGGAVSLDDAETVSEEAARLAARSEPEARAGIGWIIGFSAIGLLMALAGAIGLLLHGRRKRKSTTMPPPANWQPVQPEPVRVSTPAIEPPPPIVTEPKICPKCRRGYPPDAIRCAQDGTELLKYAEFTEKSAKEAQATKVCPTCGAHFPATTRFCGKDGTTLVGQ